MSSKYAKYSTEQLEVIYTHLADPEEKELVKKELSSRYYQHYLNVSNVSQDELAKSKAYVPEEPAEAGPEAAEAPDDENEAEDEELADLGELEPIKLTSPVQPETAAGQAPPAEKVSKKYCFIATAAYGSLLAREVVLLQNYRDHYLSRTPTGRKIVEVYYWISPYPAELIKQNKILKMLARCLLTPFIFLIKNHRQVIP